MKYLKTFEKLNKPKVGDYVYIYSDYADKDIIDFLSDNIGQIIKIKKNNQYIVKFDNVPDKFNIESKNHDDNLDYAFSENTWDTDYDEIIKFAPTKEEIEMYLNSNKYNL